MPYGNHKGNICSNYSREHDKDIMNMKRHQNPKKKAGNKEKWIYKTTKKQNGRKQQNGSNNQK